MTVFFSADLHIFHENIIKYCDRPYKDVNHMNFGLINSWNSIVTPYDSVYVLGDVAMGKRQESIELVKKLNGHKYLVPGNHDNVHPMHAGKKNFQESLAMYLEAFDDILDIEYCLNGMYRLSHFPYRNDSTDYDGRDFSAWQAQDDGMILLCGHVHNLWKWSETKNGTIQINVGCDVWGYRPVAFEEIHEFSKSLSRKGE